MSQEINFKIQSDDSPSIKKVLAYLKDIRSITCNQEKGGSGLWNIVCAAQNSDKLIASLTPQNFLGQLKSLSETLLSAGFGREAEALTDVYGISTLSTDFGGLGYNTNAQLDQKEEAEALFLVSAWLEALNSADRSKAPATHLPSRPEGRRSMTLSEKIFAAHDIDRRGEVKPGDVVRVNVDWIMASELSWKVWMFFIFIKLKD